MASVGSVARGLIWKAIGWPWLRAIGVVVSAVSLLVVLVIAVERGPDGVGAVWDTVGAQLPLILFGLAPLLGALGVAWGWTQMEVGGEIEALAVSGIGQPLLIRVAACLGAAFGLISIGLAEWWLPLMDTPVESYWMWTELGPQRTRDGLVVLLDDGGRVITSPVDPDAVALLRPRTASFALLDPHAGGAVATEWALRLARLPACMGFSVLAAVAGGRGRPMLMVVCTGGALMVLEIAGWTLGSHGHLPPWLAGSLSAWTWVIPLLIMRSQSEI